MHSFPYITWDKHGYLVSHEELLEALKSVEAGDVLLCTKKGYFLSNAAIPGLFKHAAMFSSGPACVKSVAKVTNNSGNPLDSGIIEISQLCDISRVSLIEAVSEGVVEHHPCHARGDYMIVLRPKGASGEDTQQAVKTARKIVGCDYDASFKFDIEKELTELKKKKTVVSSIKEVKKLEEDIKELKIATVNVKAEYDMGFSCTETVAVAWWHKRNDLRIYRQYKRGRSIITADQFVNRGFSVVWTNVPSLVAEKSGLHEEGLGMLDEYWATAAKAKDNENS
jgi:hypothetical protein